MQHRQNLLDEAHKAKLKRKQEEFEQHLKQEKNLLLLKAEFYKTLQTNGVDLTKYLVAKVSSEKKCDKKNKNQKGWKDEWLDLDEDA